MVYSVLAIDPGRDKCGLACVEDAGRIVWQETLPAARLFQKLPEYLTKYQPAKILIGRGGGHEQWQKFLAKNTTISFELVDERGSTLAARQLYWEQHPPRGWRRWLPLSLQTPPEPHDGLAAVVIARRFLARSVVKTGRN